MWKGNQERTPIVEAVNKYVEDKIIPFHVPGHKQGLGNTELRDYLGSKALEIDLTCMENLDNICNPLGAIKEAQELAAEVYKADHSYFLVNGTTSGIQGMIMSVCKPGEKIIIPRNAHKSAVSGIILSGAIPIYIEPEISIEYGMALQITPEKVEYTLKMHPDAKAVFVINPTYYGVVSDLKGIVDVAHSHGIPVVVDEAHGSHLYFSSQLPMSAMEAGADLAAVSTHKLAGSMTQSSILLLNEGLISQKHVKSVLNLMQTTSPSYILLVSLDIARKQMALSGREMIANTMTISEKICYEIRKMEGIALIEDKLAEHNSFYGFDKTKITINVKGLGLSGYDVEKILRDKYGIQVELSDLFNVIFLISIGDNMDKAEVLITALRDMIKSHSKQKVLKYSVQLPEIPNLSVSPQEAFYSETKTVRLDQAAGEISAEMIMAYPPGIPIICPGERITEGVINYVKVLKIEKADLQGPEDPLIENIKVLENRLILVNDDLCGEGDVNDNVI
ncbi:arginine/lysine/ornithine decarboxylase [Desulfitispora alkaliphila]|uniref:aminotransferase class I/II-fold pyridoxal phosphate-dependent enzyme n=1 Tax=Desulfitispora alkaliphila TaxID=622674 RepID=UPI003D23AE76